MGVGSTEVVGLSHPMVLSHLQAQPLLAARKEGRDTLRVSPDLGLTDVEVRLAVDGAVFPSGEALAWEGLEQIAASRGSGRMSARCFVLEDGAPRPVQMFSPLTNRLYSLMPTHGAPTITVAGFPMHRVKGTDPDADTREKIRAVAPLTGRVLDTATGLGYTAIHAARTAAQVITLELDPAALDIARLNPWSRDLFENPRITQRIGDSYDLVLEFEDGYFTRIIHDPPALSLAGHLYSGEFYGRLYRVLGRNGRLFHYIGNPESASGRRVTKGVVRRLREAGFSRVLPRPEAFGVVASK